MPILVLVVVLVLDFLADSRTSTRTTTRTIHRRTSFPTASPASPTVRTHTRPDTQTCPTYGPQTGWQGWTVGSDAIRLQPLSYNQNFGIRIVMFVVSSLKLRRRLRRELGMGLLLLGLISAGATPRDEAQPVQIRFVDSATGQAVKPTIVEAAPPDGRSIRRVRRNGVSAAGRTTLNLDTGAHSIRVVAPGYQPMTGEFVVPPGNPYQLVFHLDPVTPPAEIDPATIATWHRINETIFLGYVVADETGQPLADALVRTEPSGRETRTDERGFFQLYVPVQTRAEASATPANLQFSHPGYRTEARAYLELWSQGDWIYRIRLERGHEVKTVDERQLRPPHGLSGGHPRGSPGPARARNDGIVIRCELARPHPNGICRQRGPGAGHGSDVGPHSAGAHSHQHPRAATGRSDD
jgi:hypothetical protein